MGASITPTCIEYTTGYKYRLRNPYSVNTGIIPDKAINTKYIRLYKSGLLTLAAEYEWDGPSGPAIDTTNFMRGSLVHDAFYQLMREGYLDKEKFREPADRLLESMCKEDGMTALRAWWVYKGVRFGGDKALQPRPVAWEEYRAPKGCK